MPTLSESIERFLKYKKATGREGTTMKWYEGVLNILASHFGANADIATISEDMLIDYLAECRERLARDAADSYIRAFKSFITWSAKRFGHANIMQDIPYPQTKSTPVKPMKTAVFRSLFAIANTRDKALMLMLLATGARSGEVLQITISGIDHAQRRFLVRGKGAKFRYLTWDSLTHEYIVKWIQQHPKTSDSLWVSANTGEVLTYSGLYQLFKRLGRRAGIKNERCHPHSIRHLSATLKSSEGMSQEALRRKMGHESVRTTQRYTQFTDEELDAIDRRFDPVAYVIQDRDILP